MPSRDFSLHGAIDLGARQAAVKKQQERQAAAARSGPAGGASGASGSSGAAGAPGAPAADADGQYVIDVTDETFNAEVVDRSHSVPVLIDFWAEWCGPCRQLSPILEKLAAEAAGKWVLAKVDIDANPRLAASMQQMGVQGIPFVAVVVAGRLLPFLNGAAPEPQVRQAIGQLFDALRQEGLLPAEGEQPADAAGSAATGDPLYDEADEALARGDLQAARTAYQRVLEKAPADPYAKGRLAELDLVDRVGQIDAAQALRDAADAPADVRAQVRAADIEMVGGQVEEAFDRLIGAVRRSTGDDRNAARVHLLKLFEIMPADDPRVVKARRALQSALF